MTHRETNNATTAQLLLGACYVHKWQVGRTLLPPSLTVARRLAVQLAGPNPKKREKGRKRSPRSFRMRKRALRGRPAPIVVARSAAVRKLFLLLSLLSLSFERSERTVPPVASQRARVRESATESAGGAALLHKVCWRGCCQPRREF